MAKTITRSAVLPASPERLYEMYLDPGAHAAFTGSPVRIGPKPGDPFEAFAGTLSGTMLHTQPQRMIVQTWRSARWPARAVDSILVLTFWPNGEEGRIELVHVNVPETDFAGVTEGWDKFYWGPWRTYLSRP